MNFHVHHDTGKAEAEQAPTELSATSVIVPDFNLVPREFFGSGQRPKRIVVVVVVVENRDLHRRCPSRELKDCFSGRRDLTSVQAAIDRRKKNRLADPGLLARLGSTLTSNDFWFTTLVPISEFADSMPNEDLQGAMKGNLMQGITQASGGIKFGNTLKISGEANTRSEKGCTSSDGSWCAS